MSHTKHDAQLKQDVLEAIQNSSKPIAQVARDYGVSPKTGYSWVKTCKRKNDQAQLK